MHAQACIITSHAHTHEVHNVPDIAMMEHNALRCLLAWMHMHCVLRHALRVSHRNVHRQAVGTDKGSTPLHCSSLHRMAQCMKAWLVISMFHQFYHSRCWWMENYHKYCYFARPLKANREPRSAYLPDGEAILIMEGILPGWGSCIALCLGWPLRLLQTSVTRPYNFW